MSDTLKEELLTIIQQPHTKWTTNELSDLIQRSRSVTSLYLNELARNGAIEKSNTRPVYWSAQMMPSSSNTSSDAFKHFIGSSLGFAQTIEEIKDALMYPPIGLPILLHGNSGVGKSYLAHLIAEYLKDEELPCSDHLIVFNCADYANNPELLSSVLFGYVKGAFTGATSDKSGILEQANNGILFLDEVHRLTLENQEKLFQFLDKGYFRRLGEDTQVIHSNARLLLATTEEPSEALLPTFYRRIPLIVHLQDFHQRTRPERIKLVAHLFKREGERIHKKIAIEADLLEQLISRKYSGNVGSLSNEIKILCAQAYRKHPDDGQLLYIALNRQHTQLNWLAVDELVLPAKPLDQSIKEEWYHLLTQDDVHALKQQLEPFIQSLHDAFDHDFLVALYQSQIQQMKQQLYATLPYTQTSPHFQADFWHHLMMLWSIELNDESVYQEIYQRLKAVYPRAVSLAHQIIGERAVLARIVPFVFMLIGKVSERIQYHALLVAHGESTASSIQSVANQMLNQYVFDAINVPLNSSPEDIIVEVKEWLLERDTSNGVMMLVDMGSLTQLYKGLKPQIKGELLVVNNLTTSYALEIGQKIIQKEPFYALVDEIKPIFQTNIQYFEGFDIQTNVIVSSISGPEITSSIAKILKQYVQTNIKVVEMEYTELIDLLNRTQADQQYFSSTVAIVTTTPLNTPAAVEIINLMDILTNKQDPAYLKPFEPLITESAKQSVLNDLLYLFSKEGLTEKLEFLNPDVIITQVEHVLNRFEQRFQYPFDVQVKFVLSMHIAVLIERTMLGAEAYDIPVDLGTLKINQKLFLPNMKSILFELEQFYRISISDWEIYVIYEIISASDHRLNSSS
ncbi:sigma 54-interacting transcriptional regulator [Atopobacter phocae]|uniref:sigma 54-interacting transcriptional regulator n=1 Tax=Atopobacter phocae TaxID=136492 RepID=UPI0004714887|nr:sigma 54-interacting transcriptional regulator [Atopobacter phocae]